MPVFISDRQWDSTIQRIVRANLKAHGRSLSAASMRGGNLILEIQTDRQGMIVVDNWWQELKLRYLVPPPTADLREQDLYRISRWLLDHVPIVHSATAARSIAVGLVSSQDYDRSKPIFGNRIAGYDFDVPAPATL